MKLATKFVAILERAVDQITEIMLSVATAIEEARENVDIIEEEDTGR